MRVLIVEDDRKTADYLVKGLSENGFVVDSAANGVDGLDLARARAYDLLILDVMLPGRNGWDIITELRQLGREMPIIFLTALDAVQDRIKGLELGADDYLVKPFSFSELLARIRTIMRRGPVRHPEVLRIADLEVDVPGRKVLRGGIEIELTSREFLLLSLLLRRRGEVLSKNLIAEQVWDINFESDSNPIEVAVRRLRKKVDDPFAEKLIHTVRGVGYVLEEQQ
jgi:two-component system, OmpR family, copper resistance phosphate regulon response regulator CusR